MIHGKRNVLSSFGLVLLSGIVVSAAWADDYFDPAFIENHGQRHAQPADLSAFSSANGQIPGRYRVSVFLNETPLGVQDIDFTLANQQDGTQALQGCLSIAALNAAGVKTALFPSLSDAHACADLSVIPAASQRLDFDNQKLLLSIPQLYIANSARGYVPPEKWDNGISALLLNYSFNTYQTSDSDESKYLALQPGLNVGLWRLRNYSIWNSQSGESDWNSVYNFLQRDVIALKSRLTAWDSSTPTDIFDSVSFRGIQLASDDQMLPNSLRGYAPAIHGVARTNAQVIVRQNGYIAYQTAVPPGEFEINDMFPTGGNGDYDVTIKEADGSEQHFVVPYSSLPLLQREGRAKYSVTAGKYRDNNNKARENFAQATLLYGLPWGLTVYGGSQIAGDRYQSAAIGMGQNMNTLGAVSVDGIWSHARFDDDRRETGQSWRVRYSKGVISTGTNLSLAGYRYASKNFNTLEDALNPDEDFYQYYGKRRNRLEASINQALGEALGMLSVSWVKEDYWQSAQKMTSLTVGYNNSWGPVSYAINYSYNKNIWQRYADENDDEDDRYHQNDRLFTLSLNVPFSLFDSRMYASYMLNTRKNNATVNSTTLSGNALPGDNLNWSLQQSHSNVDGDTSGISASYKGTYANLNAGYSQSSGAHQTSYGISGGILAHENGLTLSQPIAGAAILVKAPGAAGAQVQNQSGVKTDFRGYTVVPNVSAYSARDISLDSATFADNTDIPLNNQTVYPTNNAIVRATFDTRIGYRVLMTLRRGNGETVPFGATVSVNNEQASGLANIVGDKGQAFLSGLPETGELDVVWGNGASARCHVVYQLDPTKNINGIVTASAVCQ